MIKFEQEYRQWLERQGVGDNDRAASSPDSYVSYLHSISEVLGDDITPDLLSSEQDVLAVASRLDGSRADATIRNYKSAMRQYVSMIQARAHL